MYSISFSNRLSGLDLLLASLTTSLKFIYVSDSVKPGCCACRKQGVLIFQGDFSNGSYRIEPGYGVSWLNTLTGTGYCNMQGVLNISFPLPVNGVQRRFLRFHFYLTPDQTRYNFQVADSNTDGHGGDAADIHNVNSEVQVIASNVNGYQNYTASSSFYIDRITNGVSNRVTITIGDEYIAFDNHRGIQRVYESEFLFVLSGQSAYRGRIDHDIYMGINRVVRAIGGAPQFGRSGTGLCRAEIEAFDC